MASSGLVQALLGGGGYGVGSGIQDPATLRALQRTGLAQAMLQQGMEAGPAYPAQALGRLAQSLAGSFMLERGMGDLDAIAKDRESGAQDANTFINGGGMAPATPVTSVAPQPPQQPASGTPFAANNALNIRYAGQDGATDTKGFAAFQTPEAGAAATNRQFGLYADRGINTLNGLISRWAPPSENDTPAYIARVAKETGIDPGAQIDLRDPAVAGKIQQAMARVEGNKNANVQFAAGGNVATDASPGGAAPAAGAYDSPEIKGALATIQRAQQVLADPRYRFNPAAQEAAKTAIEQAKIQLQVGTHIADRGDAERARLDARAEAERVRADARDEARRNRDAEHDYQRSQKTPERVTMLDPDKKTSGIYEFGPQGVGKRLGDAPKQPGEGTGPFAGTGMDAQVNNTLLSIGPKIASGNVTQAERDQYALAHQHMMNGTLQSVPDPNDPTKVMLARIPGVVPPNFPHPSFLPAQAAPAGGVAPAQGAPTPAPAAPTPAAPALDQQPAPSAGGQGAPIPVPGTSRAPSEQKLTDEERKTAGFALRMQDAVKDINRLEEKGIHSGNWGASLAAGVPVVGNSLLSSDFQVYQQRAADWVRAKLRHESGAVIGEKEMADEIKNYFPERGDSPEKIAAKRRSREAAQVAMDEGAGRAHIDPSRLPAAPAPSAGIPPPPSGFKLIN